MPHDRSPKLILVHVSKSRPSGKWSDDDYDVWDANAKVVGRIFRVVTTAPQRRSWFWTITRAPQRATDRGYAATREKAMEEFKRAWKGEKRTADIGRPGR